MREKSKQCANCNKTITRDRWYYKNGEYFCNKRCFKKWKKKKEEK